MQQTVVIESLQPAIPGAGAGDPVGSPADGIGRRSPGGSRDPDQGQEAGLRLVCSQPLEHQGKEGKQCREITFTAADLGRDVEPIVATAAPEVAHLWAYNQGVSVVSGRSARLARSAWKASRPRLGLH